jgi:3-oxoacyl-[acyl-carrier-protein] synthase I
MSLFGKKPAAPAAPRTKAAPPPAPIAITVLGIACHAGDQPYNLIRSIIGQVSGVRLSDEYQFKRNDGTNALPRMAPVVEFGDTPTLDRLYELTSIALAKTAAQLPANVKPESVLIVITVAPQFIMHLLKIDPQYLQSYLVGKIPQLTSATFRILTNDTGSSTIALSTALAELNENKWQAVIFGGADSLISMDKCLELDKVKRLNTVGKREGLVPGEAAAFVLLQSADVAAKHIPVSPVLAYLRGMGIAAEPNARNADLGGTEGLSSAINQALAQAGITATDLQGIVHNLGAETVQSLEWHHTTQAIWPRRVSEQQRLAVQNGEIEQAEIPDDPIPDIECPYQTMGQVGAAALPMQLATALAWIEYDQHQARWGFPVRNHLLICDTPDAAERGALIISTTLT